MDWLVTDCAIIKKEEVLSVYAHDAYVVYIGWQNPVYNIYAKTEEGSTMLYSNIPQYNLSAYMNNLATKLIGVTCDQGVACDQEM